MDSTVARTRPMTDILKAADAPLPVAKPTNGQAVPQPMTVPEATEKLAAVMDHMKAGAENVIEDMITLLTNLKQRLALETAASQAGARKHCNLIMAINGVAEETKKIVSEIEKNHLQ